MNKFENYLVDLLQGNITYNDGVVPVRRQFLERGEAPCVTIDVGSVSTERYHRETIDGMECVLAVRTCHLYINLWCNTEDERESLSSQIMNCFMIEQTGHYTYCSRYDEGQCTSIERPCLATTVVDARTEKNQCPTPQELDYESLEQKHMIIQGSMNIEPPTRMDELEQYPPLLRNRFDCVASYYDVYTVGGTLIDEITFGNIELE